MVGFRREPPQNCHLDRSMMEWFYRHQVAERDANVGGALCVKTYRLQSANKGVRTRKLQVSPLRRQKAPPSVEMTRYGWGSKKPHYLAICAYPRRTS